MDFKEHCDAVLAEVVALMEASLKKAPCHQRIEGGHLPKREPFPFPP